MTRRLGFLLLLGFLLFASVTEADSRRFTYWSGWGRGVTGTENSTLFVAGIQYSFPLTKEHGSWNSRGFLQYSVDVYPIYLIDQDNLVYGVSITPVLIRWAFVTHRKPYLEIGGGMLFTRAKVPETTKSFNFTPQAGFGLILFEQTGYEVLGAVKYVHISNGGTARRNPGINSLQILLGFRWK